jgi:hypothetical protein
MQLEDTVPLGTPMVGEPAQMVGTARSKEVHRVSCEHLALSF